MYDCSQCPIIQQKKRKCGEDGLQNAKHPRYSVDSRGQKYTFCPGKATWYEKTAQTYQECLFAFYTGILPKEGHFQDQDEFFVEAYPAFVQHYTQRRYGRIWQDVNEFTGEVLKTIGKMFGG